MEPGAASFVDSLGQPLIALNLLERALIQKAGREHGWENVLESGDDRVLLASARHRGRAEVTEIGANQGWHVELPRGRLSRELDRTLPGLMEQSGRFRVIDIDALAAVLRRAAELSQSLPDQAAQTFRERTAARLAAISLGGTEVERLVRQRVGQDVFREALMDYWGGVCAVTGLALPGLLRASHAKPWADCISDDERLDVFNGLLLAPHLDALFDGGWISFGGCGEIVISTHLDETSRRLLNVTPELHTSWVAPEHEAYFAYHRAHVLRL